jgi:hypothetical protein
MGRIITKGVLLIKIDLTQEEGNIIFQGGREEIVFGPKYIALLFCAIHHISKGELVFWFSNIPTLCFMHYKSLRIFFGWQPFVLLVSIYWT